jgi:hypothetical protein
MTLCWTLEGHGWAVCTVSDHTTQAVTVASYVTDGPEALLTAVARIVIGATEARAEFEAEPTAYRWIFHRDGEYVTIHLLEVPARRLPDGSGIEIWLSRQRLDVLARVVVRAFDAVETEHGEAGYQATWGRPFPRSELNVLRSARLATRSQPIGSKRLGRTP